MGNTTARDVAEGVLGFYCPECKEAIEVADAVWNLLKSVSEYECHCPHCQSDLKQHYQQKIKRRRRVSSASTRQLNSRRIQQKNGARTKASGVKCVRHIDQKTR